MNDAQKNITDTINKNSSDQNIKPMINTQNNNLEKIKETMEEAEALIEKTDKETAKKINDTRTGDAQKKIKEEMEEILNDKSNNQETMMQSSNSIENNIEQLMQEMDSIISSYKKKENLEMLVKYIRIIKNLIDMSYEQELIISESKNIKSKKDENISIIASKQNILIQQYKNTFIQIADLAKQSFHIKPETSKTFSQIFNNFSKTIAGFEQGKITTAKKQKSTFGFGTTEQLYEMGYPIIKHSTFPYKNDKVNKNSLIPCEKIIGEANNRQKPYVPKSIINIRSFSK